MTATVLNDVNAQIQKFWAPMFVSELKESALIPNLVNTTYSSDIKALGNAVTVSMVRAATGSNQAISNDGSHTVIYSEKLQTVDVQVVADRVFSASFKLDSLIGLQSQLGSADGQSAIRASLLKAIELKINEYIYSLAIASTANPDHNVSGVTDFNFTQLQATRLLASKAKWSRAEGLWNLLLDPSYYNDFMADQKNTSSDYVGADLPLIGGQRPFARSGFQIFEDNSDGMSKLSPTLATSDLGLAFHRDFLYMVMQTQPEFKLSDLHPNGERGYLLTVDLVGGAKLGIEGNKKVIQIYNA